MTKEIKFRAWDTDKKVMCKVEKLLFGTAGISFDDGSGQWFGDLFPLMQFTGLKDKNGKEIYEGDIVKYTEHKDYLLNSFTGEVQYFGIDLEIDGFNGGVCLNEIDELYHDFLSHCEVIGNIYENPELIK